MVDMNPASCPHEPVVRDDESPRVAYADVDASFRFPECYFMTQGFRTIPSNRARGGDKLYSANWFMSAFEHRVGRKGAFQAEVMLSLEPATVTNRSYPLLFQTGETAYGKPLVDAQHPHNFVMALGLHYARELSENTMLHLYFAPVGDPALGPVAFPHRASAAELPQAPISHHWQDSTHIAAEVVTAGIDYRKIRLEASGFHGASRRNHASFRRAHRFMVRGSGSFPIGS